MNEQQAVLFFTINSDSHPYHYYSIWTFEKNCGIVMLGQFCWLLLTSIYYTRVTKYCHISGFRVLALVVQCLSWCLIYFWGVPLGCSSFVGAAWLYSIELMGYDVTVDDYVLCCLLVNYTRTFLFIAFFFKYVTLSIATNKKIANYNYNTSNSKMGLIKYQSHVSVFIYNQFILKYIHFGDQLMPILTKQCLLQYLNNNKDIEQIGIGTTHGDNSICFAIIFDIDNCI